MPKKQDTLLPNILHITTPAWQVSKVALDAKLCRLIRASILLAGPLLARCGEMQLPLPGGDVIVLERRFRYSEGVKMRLRRIRAKDIKAGAKLDGDVLLKTDDLREIDNMEALAVHRDGRGRNILTILSDNNFNTRFQRTLLMQFASVE